MSILQKQNPSTRDLTAPFKDAQEAVDETVKLILEARRLKARKKEIEKTLALVQEHHLHVGGWVNSNKNYIVTSDERGLHITELSAPLPA